MQHWAITALAVALAVFTAPLFFDLALAIVGNLFPARGPQADAKLNIRVAVVVPAHDEEAMIARTVASIRAADLAVPVFVVAHNCTDATGEVAAKAGAQVLELNDPALRGKAAALRAGFAAALEAGANALLVIDADSVVSANLIAATRKAMEAGAEATQCRYELEISAAAGARGRLRALAFRGMNVLRAAGRAGLGFSAGVFGNGFGLTASTLNSVPFAADSIAEDLEYHVRLVSSGLRVHWLEDAFVHAPLASAGRAQAAQESRWEGGRLGVARRSTGRLLAAILRGNWRALETLAEVWSLPLSRGILALLLAAVVPVFWLQMYAVACLAIAVIYVLEAALLGQEPLRDLVALAAAPWHMVWRVAITPLVLRQSRRRAEWARTKREAPRP